MNKLLPGQCPCCRKILTAHAEAGKLVDNIPRPGNISICSFCFNVLVFENEGMLREFTPEELWQEEKRFPGFAGDIQYNIEYAKKFRARRNKDRTRNN